MQLGARRRRQAPARLGILVGRRPAVAPRDALGVLGMAFIAPVVIFWRCCGAVAALAWPGRRLGRMRWGHTQLEAKRAQNRVAPAGKPHHKKI